MRAIVADARNARRQLWQARKPPLLHLKSHGLIDPEDDRSIELAVYDVLLPCRMFLIDHKVAVLGRTSLTTEFLLRLVKAVPGISQEDAAAFFGFNLRETSFVLAEAEAPGFIERSDGRLWLTGAGDGLFRDGSSEPEIFAVEPRRREVGFDLISLAPQHPRFLTAPSVLVKTRELGFFVLRGGEGLG